jgi:hypothetical protein
MMENTAEDMARTIIEGGNFDLVYYLLILCLIVVGTYLGSFLREYSRKRADQFATKADLIEIQNQLRASVEITESVKRDIEQGAWRERELELLKRDKLEQYLLNYYTEVENLSRRMKRDFFYDKTPFNETADAKISMLQKLYLPEMDLVHANFLRVHAEFTRWLGNGQQLLLSQKQAGVSLPVIPSEHMEHYSSLLSKLNECTLSIEAKAQEVGRSINVA